MKKRLRRHVNQGMPLWVLLCFLVLTGLFANRAQAQSNYLLTLELTDLSWDYPEADCNIGLSSCGGIPIFAAEDAGDFGFTVDGRFYQLPEDFGPNTGLYSADYNLGILLQDIVWVGVVPQGGTVPTVNITFQAFENDCGELFYFDTGLSCTVNADDSHVDQVDPIVFPAAALAGSPLVPGTYPNIAFGPFDGGDGSSYGAVFTLNITEVPTAAAPCDLDILEADGNGYQCLGEEAATTSVTIFDGAAPYRVIGSGIYAIGGVSYPGLANAGLATGEPLDFGLDGFGLVYAANPGDFNFYVREDQPWQVIVIDNNGCTVAAEGVYDLPEPSIASDFSSVCINGPIFNLYDEAIFQSPNGDPLGSWTIDYDYDGTNDAFLANSYEFTFDPNDAGTGQHHISYCYDIPDDLTQSPYSANADAYDNCDATICDDMVINVFPAWFSEEVTFGLPVSTTTCAAGTGGTPGLPLVLDNFTAISGDFAQVEDAFDPNHNITEMDYFVTWTGPGVFDMGITGNYFDPAVAGPGVHTVCVEVGYPDCATNYCRTITVESTFDPATALNPNFIVCGNVSGQAQLQGSQEVPASGSSATGDVFYTLDGNVLTINMTYSGLSSNATNAHLHGPAAAGTNAGVIAALPGFPANPGTYGTYSGTITLTAAQTADFIAGRTYVNLHTASFTNGEIRAQLSPFTGSLVCSSDEACPITINAAAAAAAFTFTGNGTFTSAAAGPGVANATITIPQAQQITQYADITDITITYDYVGTAGTSEGDHNGYTIVGPGGVTILTVADPPLGDPSNDHFATQTITFEQILAAYDALTPAVAGDGEANFINAVKCTNPTFTYNLTSNSLNWSIHIGASISYINKYGEMQATIAETSQVLPDEAITFDPATLTYYFNSHFVDASGEYWDLGAYDEIEVCFLNVGNCATLNAGGTAGGTPQCAAQSCLTVQVVTGGNASLSHTPLCLSSFDPLHLPTAFWVDGVTTPGGVWTISDVNSLDGASNTGGNGVYGEFFNPASLAPGSYTVCYSLFESEGNSVIECNEPELGADCATIIVPTHYCVDFPEHVVCENCTASGLLPIIIGTVDANGDCMPIDIDIDVVSGVTETFAVCRSDIDNNNSDGDNNTATGINDPQNQRPTTLDAWDAYGHADSDAATAVCSDNPATIEKVEGLYTILENTITLPANILVDDIVFHYNYVSTTGTAQGDHDGWGVFFNDIPSCVGSNPVGQLVDDQGDIIGYGDNQDPDGDNHFPAGFPSDAFEDRNASDAHIASIQNIINTLPDGQCEVTFSYYYIIASNSQYWNACFNVDFEYHFAPGAEPEPAISAVFHEPSEEGNWVDLYPQWIPTNPVIQETDPVTGETSFWLNTCNLGQFDEISVVLNIQAALANECGETTDETCFANAYSPALVVLDNDGFSCGFTTNVSPSVCQGQTITITPDGGSLAGTYTFVDTYTWPIADADASTPGIQFVVPTMSPDGTTAVSGGLYTIVHSSVSPNGCSCVTSQSVLVVEAPNAVTTGGTTTFEVCASDLPLDLTQFVDGSSSLGGTFTASAGDIVNGQLLMTVAGGTASVTYTIGSEVSGCSDAVTFTVNTTTQALANVLVFPQICEGTTIDLFDYLSSNTTAGGTFYVNGTAVASAAAHDWTPAAGAYEIEYMVGTGTCAASDAGVLYVNNSFTASAEYGFVCQSETDFTIDLSQYLPEGATNGGDFNLGGLPLFISEIEYNGGPQIPVGGQNLDWIEVTGQAGTDLSDYALVFYKRMGYTNDGVWNDYVNSGKMYGWINLSGTIDNEVTASSGISYGSVAFTYADYVDASNPGNDVDCKGNVLTEGQAITGIADGPAAIALVWVGDQDCDELDNDDVIQYIGYGITASNTNSGIFSACDGPARTLVPEDINVVDAGGYSVQFTNACWVVPSVDDPEVAYATTGVGISDADSDGNGDRSTAGQLNLGLVGDTAAEGNDYGHGGADELYFDYVAPNGDVLKLNQLCATLFVGGQIVNTAPWVNQENQVPGNGFQDGDVVRFECQTQTYTIPFNYSFSGNGTGTVCASDNAVFYLTVLQDYEENWNGSAPGIDSPTGSHTPGAHGYDVLKNGVCNGSETNLNQYIDDIVHYIQPVHYEGSFDTTKTFTFAENVKLPYFSELHYSHYGYPGAAADDHCVIYNYIDNGGTPFNTDDDEFDSWNFCEGIELSAEAGTELSCYGLVFYAPNSPNGRGLAVDVTYIGVDGMPHTTDVANGVYMQLYGRITEDEETLWSAPNGSILSVPADNGEIDPFGHLPWYGGANPFTGSNGNGPANGGLYVDVNSNERFDAADIPVPSAVAGVPSDAANFPWEHAPECNKTNVGSRWFPVLDIPGGPGQVAGVGLINQCNGELVKYISWGDANGDGNSDAICNEDKEGFTLAGPFEQITSTPIDTFQNANGTLGDQRSLQLVSSSMLGSAAPAGVSQVWVLSYNGGAFHVPGGGVLAADEELYEFGNSFGYFNCRESETDAVAAPQSFTLNLANSTLPNNFVITGHTINVTIGSMDNNYSQLYTYHIGMGACEVPNNAADLDEYSNTNVVNLVPGQYCGGDFDADYYNTDGGPLVALDVDINPTDGIYDFLTAPFSAICSNNPWSEGNMPSPVYMGSTVDPYGYPAFNGFDVTWGCHSEPDSHCLGCTSDPNYCNDDLEFAPLQPNWVWTTTDGPAANGELANVSNQEVKNGELQFAFDNGDAPLNPDAACFEGYCTMLAKTTYTVSDLRALLYNGNIIQGYENGSIDTCRVLMPDIDSVRVTISVHVDYEQCLPVGTFAGTGVVYNDDNINYPYWSFEPDGIDAGEVWVTYDVTNAHEIETDDATDDLACLDDDNDNIRTQQIHIIGGSSACVTSAATTVCTANLPLNLGSLACSGGTWSGTGVNGSSFTAAPGTYTLTLTTGSGACTDAATVTVTVEQSASVNLSGIPTAVCAGASVNLPTGVTWSGEGVSGNTFNTAGLSGSKTLSYSGGGATCGTSGTVTINVTAGITASESFDAGSCTATITFAGGNGSYTVNGVSISGNTFPASVTSGGMVALNVSSGACSQAFNFGPFNCCSATVNNLSISGGLDFCGTGGFTAQSDATGGTVNYILVDAAGNFAGFSGDGSFTNVPAGSYCVWVAVSSGLDVTSLNSISEIQSAIAGGACADLAGPQCITVTPGITLSLEAVCVTGVGYLIQATVSGGCVETNGFGAYDLNFQIDAGTPTFSGTVLTLSDNGNPFPAGAEVSVSAEDGCLCFVSETITLPADLCATSANANSDNALTLADVPVVIDVTANDSGTGLNISGFTQPSNGSVVLDGNGNFVYTPNDGFTGTDVFTYQVTDAYGYTTLTSVFVQVTGSSALSAVDVRDCSQAEITGFSVVTVTVTGGSAPYTVTGSYNGTLAASGSVSFDVAEGSGYYVEVVDASGTNIVIDQSDIEPCSKVSVELLSFGGEVKAEGNDLNWATASEVNNDHFILEYSTNGIDYHVIKTVAGNGNSSVANNYGYMHKEAQPGIGYYRLSTVDFDGNVVVEGVITLTRGELGFGFVNLYPVPAKVTLHVDFSVANPADVRLDVHNISGQLVNTQTVHSTVGVNNATVNVTNFAAGTYFVSINDGTQIRVTKFVKE